MTPPAAPNERTSLAWLRTALGLAGCALLAGRLADTRGTPWGVAAGLAAALLACGVLGWSHERYRRATREPVAHRPADTALPALLLTLSVALVGVLGLLLIAR